MVGSKFPFFALFYFVFERNFPSTSPQGAYIWRGDLTEVFLRYRFGRLIQLFPVFRERLSGKVHATIQSRKALWVVLNSLFFKEI